MQNRRIFFSQLKDKIIQLACHETINVLLYAEKFFNITRPMKVVGRRTGCKRSGIFPLRQQRKEARGRLAHQPRRLLPPRAKRRSSRSGPGEVGGGMAGEKMAKCEPCERSYDNMVKMLEDLNRDLEKLLEDMEKLSGYLDGL
ncbi:synaptonemal complex central element protein 3 isoform X2 [Pantherophis guttatus]|uniref:Synaptonemal complex central element protein 3 isoform X2 n=1 Tax=Pantherophis guttatus TaxID=94885 RepID=A0A6P9B7T4_PANGU|nr:synaptonemal complex central element protein 3 isoform X2 [Pantherophis guttatus]